MRNFVVLGHLVVCACLPCAVPEERSRAAVAFLLSCAAVRQVEMLRASDESPVEFLVHNEAEGRKYVAILLKLMNNSAGDARAQHFAVSRYSIRLRHRWTARE